MHSDFCPFELCSLGFPLGFPASSHCLINAVYQDWLRTHSISDQDKVVINYETFFIFKLTVLYPHYNYFLKQCYLISSCSSSMLEVHENVQELMFQKNTQGNVLLHENLYFLSCLHFIPLFHKYLFPESVIDKYTQTHILHHCCKAHIHTLY